MGMAGDIFSWNTTLVALWPRSHCGTVLQSKSWMSLSTTRQWRRPPGLAGLGEPRLPKVSQPRVLQGRRPQHLQPGGKNSRKCNRAKPAMRGLWLERNGSCSTWEWGAASGQWLGRSFGHTSAHPNISSTLEKYDSRLRGGTLPSSWTLPWQVILYFQSHRKHHT